MNLAVAEHGQRFSDTRYIKPLTVTSWAENRLGVLGLNGEGEVLQLYYDGGWIWNDLGGEWKVKMACWHGGSGRQLAFLLRVNRPAGRSF